MKLISSISTKNRLITSSSAVVLVNKSAGCIVPKMARWDFQKAINFVLTHSSPSSPLKVIFSDNTPFFPHINEVPRRDDHMKLFRESILNSNNVVLAWAIGDFRYHFSGPLNDILKWISIHSSDYVKKMTVFLGNHDSFTLRHYCLFAGTHNMDCSSAYNLKRSVMASGCCCVLVHQDRAPQKFHLIHPSVRVWKKSKKLEQLNHLF